MGKSNKFDYTNRSSAGVKMGKIIGQALEKEAVRLQKDALKQVEKSHGHKREGSAGDAKEFEPHAHHIDLQAPNKDLGDEGLFALADGLENALRQTTSIVSLGLVDAKLSGNHLTTASLARLAPIIALSNLDLKTLDLSDNDIKVENEKESAQWEEFLSAFQGCFRLRRLDLSNNKQLGPKAMEVFAKVHIKEEPITPIEPFGIDSVHSIASKQGDDVFHHSRSNSLASVDYDTKVEDALAKGRVIPRRLGLRSIPFIELHNTALSGGGALWLSYIMEDHYYPAQLTDQLNATLPHTNIKTYQQPEHSGIVWESNVATLGKDGLFLLQKTEVARKATLFEEFDAAMDSMTSSDCEGVNQNGEENKKTSLERRDSKSGVIVSKRASMRSIRTNDGGEHEASEIESCRKKIQRHIIEVDSAASVELWIAALRQVKCSRMLAFIAPYTSKLYVDGTQYTSPSLPASPITVSGSPNATPKRQYNSSQLSFNGNKQWSLSPESPRSPASYGSYAAKLSGPRLVEITNSPPPTHKMVFKHRKGADDYTDMGAVNQKLSGLAMSTSAEKYINYQERRMEDAAEEGTLFRDSSNAGNLPRNIIDRIAGFTNLGKGAEAMTQTQRDAAFEWGRNKATLSTEMEWRKKDDSSQVWMLLDSIGCLAYGQ